MSKRLEYGQRSSLSWWMLIHMVCHQTIALICFPVDSVVFAIDSNAAASASAFADWTSIKHHWQPQLMKQLILNRIKLIHRGKPPVGITTQMGAVQGTDKILGVRVIARSSRIATIGSRVAVVPGKGFILVMDCTVNSLVFPDKAGDIPHRSICSGRCPVPAQPTKPQQRTVKQSIQKSPSVLFFSW